MTHPIYDLTPNRNPYYLARQAMQRGAAQAAPQAGGGLLGMTLPAWVGTLAFAGLVGAVAWTGYEGYQLYRAGQEVTPEHVLAAMSERVAEARAESKENTEFQRSQTQANAVGGYFVVEANGGKILSVRSGRHFHHDRTPREPILSNQFRHGGIKAEDSKARAIAGPFETPQLATEYLADRVADGTVVKPRLAAGFHGQVGGRYVTIDDWGLVDFGVLDSRGKCRSGC